MPQAKKGGLASASIARTSPDPCPTVSVGGVSTLRLLTSRGAVDGVENETRGTGKILAGDGDAVETADDGEGSAKENNFFSCRFFSLWLVRVALQLLRCGFRGKNTTRCGFIVKRALLTGPPPSFAVSGAPLPLKEPTVCPRKVRGR